MSVKPAVRKVVIRPEGSSSPASVARIPSHPASFRPIRVAKASKLMPGAHVFVVGHPFMLDDHLGTDKLKGGRAAAKRLAADAKPGKKEF